MVATQARRVRWKWPKGRAEALAPKAAHLFSREGASQKKGCWGPRWQTIKSSFLFFLRWGNQELARAGIWQLQQGFSLPQIGLPLQANPVKPHAFLWLPMESTWETAFGTFQPKDEDLPEIRGLFPFNFPLPKVHFPTPFLLLCNQVLRDAWGEVLLLPEWHTQKSSTQFVEHLLFNIHLPKTFISGCYSKLVHAARWSFCCPWDTKTAGLMPVLSCLAMGTWIKLPEMPQREVGEDMLKTVLLQT